MRLRGHRGAGSFALLLAVLTAARLVPQTPTARKLTLNPSSNTFTQQGIVHGYSEALYALNLAAGQRFCLTLKPSNSSAYFNVYAPGTNPGADEALFSGSVSGERAELQVKKAGDYLIQVFLMRNAARRGAKGSFTLMGKPCESQN